MKIVRKEVLNFADIMNNNNKFYELVLSEFGDGFVLDLRWGRVGTSAQSSTKRFSDREVAEKEFEKKMKSKEKKGYVRLMMADDEVAVSSAKAKSKKSKKSGSESGVEVSQEVLDLISKLLGASKGYVRENVQTPVGKLSAKQVSMGRKELAKITRKLGLKRKVAESEYVELSNNFYRLIPIVFNKTGGGSWLVINSLEKVAKYSDLLDVMESLVSANVSDDIVDQYASMGLKMNCLSKSDVEYERLEKLVMDTKAPNHHFSMSVKNVYEVESMRYPEEFNPYGVETMELFHGSRTPNIIHVLQQGLRIKPSGAVHTGSMFGDGIYFASNSTKSANYCWGFGSRAIGETFYMFVCEVATGRIKDYESAKSSLKSAPYGYNSVRGTKGRHLQNDEYIVYRESQVRIKYVIEFTSR